MSRSKNHDKKTILPTEISKLTGQIPHPLKNDFMARFTMQESKAVLISLIASLLGMSPDSIEDIEIKNPIGLNADYKETVMDILVTLNNEKLINVEILTYIDGDWTSRSLLYMCRAYDQLKSGDNYDLLQPTLHVSIMDYTLFHDAPEFYARYQLRNIRNNKVYSDKLALNVLDLSRIDLATEEDHLSGLVHWAKIFQATTWEELRALSTENPVFTEVIAAMVKVSNDKEKRYLIEGRMNYIATMNTIRSRAEKAEARADEAVARADEAVALADKAEARANKAEARADALEAELKKALEELEKYKQ